MTSDRNDLKNSVEVLSISWIMGTLFIKGFFTFTDCPYLKVLRHALSILL